MSSKPTYSVSRVKLAPTGDNMNSEVNFCLSVYNLNTDKTPEELSEELTSILEKASYAFIQKIAKDGKWLTGFETTLKDSIKIPESVRFIFEKSGVEIK